VWSERPFCVNQVLRTAGLLPGLGFVYRFSHNRTSTPALALESLIAGTFLALAVTGFKKNLCLIVTARTGHGVRLFSSPLL
jgi:hypothetical protein